MFLEVCSGVCSSFCVFEKFFDGSSGSLRVLQEFFQGFASFHDLF